MTAATAFSSCPEDYRVTEFFEEREDGEGGKVTRRRIVGAREVGSPGMYSLPEIPFKEEFVHVSGLPTNDRPDSTSVSWPAARLMATETFTFFGNALMHSLALPLKILFFVSASIPTTPGSWWS